MPDSALRQLTQKILDKHDDIKSWLSTAQSQHELPLYTSVDIRDAGFKCAVVDTNLYPAGFNNLCLLSLEKAAPTFRQTVLERAPQCKNIALITEEHTRNTWYLENARVLQNLIETAGFSCKVSTFLEDTDECNTQGFHEFTTATGKPLKVYCLKDYLNKIYAKEEECDLFILNNDLTSGIPEFLQNTHIPIYPSLQTGWHSRTKTDHFRHTNELIGEFAKLIDEDPWLLSCLFKQSPICDINNDADRSKLAKMSEALLTDIQAKYDEHGINEKPFIFLKSDSGTYGMGIHAIEDPQQLIDLNRKGRNKLSKGKSTQQISQFILQEGVPSIRNIDQYIGETCVYQIGSQAIGSFYRLNEKKGSRDNLNSSGMVFKKVCENQDQNPDCQINQDGNCGVLPNSTILTLYHQLGKIAAIAASHETYHLENQS